MTETARVRNTASRVVLDGGGRVTLSGMGRRRILYMDTCDPKQVWTTSHCQDQANPQLTVENMGFVDGNSTGRRYEGGGGGAIFDRGGRLRIAGASSSATAASAPALTSAAGPSVRCRSTTGIRCSSPAADSPTTSVATVARSAASGCRGRCEEAASLATGRSGSAPIRNGPGRPAEAAAARSITTATG